jgi:hypothetical protein
VASQSDLVIVLEMVTAVAVSYVLLLLAIRITAVLLINDILVLIDIAVQNYFLILNYPIRITS